ncbi:MAG: carbamoyltransferase C-terminal domain-containing protein, partial [Nitrospiraceae bacterium]
TYPVRASAKGILPAVVHVDGTARIQTVDRDSNPRFRRLLQAFEQKTGVPVLLNTSFNVQEPIVCTPDDAVKCFLRTGVDWLVLGNLLVKNPNRTEC